MKVDEIKPETSPTAPPPKEIIVVLLSHPNSIIWLIALLYSFILFAASPIGSVI